MLTFGDFGISMVGLGIIIFILVVVTTIRNKSSHYETLNFTRFFSHVPFIIISCYLVGSRTRYFINQLVIFPLSIEQLLLYVSPEGRTFSLLGMIVGAMLSIGSFLSKEPKINQILWIDIFFESLVIGLIPLGIFLVLGDSFIGTPTDSFLGVSAIQSDSKLALYNSVLPIGFGVSLLGILAYGVTTLYKHRWNPGYGYFGFAVILFFLGVITIYQNYARRIITTLGSIRLDIKQYVLFVLAIVMIIIRYKNKRYNR